MKIIIIGDLHGEWLWLNMLLNKQRPDLVISVGDFGWFPHLHAPTQHRPRKAYNPNEFNVKRPARFDQYGIRNLKNVPIYFCPGNHENWEDLLLRPGKKPIDLMPNVYYIPRGGVLELPYPFRTTLFMGGADSIDKLDRDRGIDWWPEELITLGDIYNLPDKKIYTVISHTCPVEFKPILFEKKKRDPFWEGKFKDPSCEMLSLVWEKYKPRTWFFGHFHVTREFKYHDTKVFALNKAPDSGWWKSFDIQGDWKHD
jgi:hypothetical protein